MPRDMAVHNPDSWIVRLESNGNVATYRQQGHISTRRIVEMEDIRIIDVGEVE